MNRMRPRQGLTAGVMTVVVVGLLTLLLSAVLAACSGDDDNDKPAPSAASKGSDGSTTVTTVTTVGDVSGGRMGDARRLQTKKQVGAVVDRFLDGAYLGSFPRTDYTAAFADFTPQAAALAGKQLDTMTNQSISEKISAATATNRRLRLTVFAPQGLARGITAKFVLDYTTTGDLEEDQRVLGQLYLTKAHGKTWQVFGFRVDQPVTR